MNKRQKILIVDDAKFLHLSAATGGKADGSYDTGIEYDQVFTHKLSELSWFILVSFILLLDPLFFIRAGSPVNIRSDLD